MKRELENPGFGGLGNDSPENVRFGRLDHTSELNTERFLKEKTAIEWVSWACDARA